MKLNFFHIKLNKSNIYSSIIILYFTYIIIGAFNMSYEGYAELHSKKYKPYYLIDKILNNQPASFINRYTGLELGYGYFAPNVKAKFFVDIIVDSNIYQPKFKTFEGYMRYTNLLSEIFSNTYNSDTSNHIAVLKKKIDNLKLINIVEYTLSSNDIKSANSIFLQCYCLGNNSMEAFRNRENSIKLLIKSIKLK